MRRAKRKYQVQNALELKEIYDQKLSELKGLEEVDSKKHHLEKQIKNLKAELERKAHEISLERKKFLKSSLVVGKKRSRIGHAAFNLFFTV